MIQKIKTILNEIHYKYIVDEIHDLSQLQATIKIKWFDLVLIEIQKNVELCFSIIKQINQREYGDLFIISSDENLVFSALSLRPFCFLRKTNLEEEMSNAFADWIEFYKKRDYIVVSMNKEKAQIYIEDITYIEVKGHNLYIHTINHQYIVRKRISDYDYLIEQYHFLKPHISYLCNMKYITKLECNDLLLCNHISIPISRTRRQTVNDIYMKYNHSVR